MKTKRLFLLFAALLLGLLWLPFAADAADISLLPKTTTVAENATFPVSLLLNSEGVDVNAVSFTLTYPQDLLEAVSIDRGGSFIRLWAEEPAIDAKTGRIHFAGGTPNGGIAYEMPLLRVMFRAKKAGSAVLAFLPDGEVLKNDGAGTPAPVTSHGATIAIGRYDFSASRILSTTHPDQSRWYALKDLVVRWSTYPNAYYSYRLTRDANEDPDTISDPIEGATRFPNLADGVWYVALRERVGEVWSSTTRFRAQIDTTPPEPIETSLTEITPGEQLLGFTANDAASGVQYYAAMIRRPTVWWFPFIISGSWERVTAPLVFRANDVIASVTLVAVDGAGNTAMTVVPFNNLHARQRIVLLSITGLILAVLCVLGILIVLRRHRR